MLKLWTANIKHYVRGVECYDDIVRMAHKLKLDNIDTKDEIELLEDTLCWLECNVSDDYIGASGILTSKPFINGSQITTYNVEQSEKI